MALSQKETFLRECQLIMKCINSLVLNSSRESENCFVLFSCVCTLPLHQAGIAETRKYVRASVGAGKERGPVYLVFTRQC